MPFWDAINGICLTLLIVCGILYVYGVWNGWNIQYKTKGIDIYYEQYATKKLFKKEK